jgi:N-acetylglucosamine kinase-like BadF-type ATPase
MARLTIGIDGGGTKTAAVAYLVGDDGDAGAGRVVGHGLAGPSNKNSVGEEAAVAALKQVSCADL